VLAVAGVGAANAAIPRSGLTPADTRQVSFSGAVSATEANENVDVVGRLHVVTQLSGSEQTGWTGEWRANLDYTTGTGRTTGDRYRGTGADSGTVAMPPGPPVREAFFEPSFTLRPPGGSIHPPSPCRLAVNVVYDETGQVSTVEVHVADGPTGTVD
jgi:hypothetical protein